MKGVKSLLLTGLLAAKLMTFSAYVRAESTVDSPKIHHLVVVWLKQTGDVALRQQYIEASKSLAALPGVLAYDVGTPALINRGHANPALDESYDVAVSAVYESQQAYEAFLKDPEYIRVAQQVLRPLVDKYKVYDFSER